MSIILQSKKESLEKYAAIIIQDAITALLRCQPKVVFAVTGGRSTPGVLKQLKDLPVYWEKVHFFMADERMVPLDHGQSNFKMVKETLLDHLLQSKALPESNVHPFIADFTKSDCGVSQYASELKQCGGTCDLLLLSAGEDGHIASLFPDHASVRDEADLFVSVADAPKPPPQRISLSRKLLVKANDAVLLFFGREKEPAFDRFLKKEGDVLSCPARLVSGITKSYVLTDLKLTNGAVPKGRRYIFRKEPCLPQL